MTERLTLIVQLHVHPDHGQDYVRFEASAERIMRSHGGRIERRIAISDDSRPGEDGLPTEVHIVTFPSRESFEAYTRDPDLEPLQEMRDRAIRRTVVWAGQDAPDFE